VKIVTCADPEEKDEDAATSSGMTAVAAVAAVAAAGKLEDSMRISLDV
jgi:hypothetical protein